MSVYIFPGEHAWILEGTDVTIWKLLRTSKVRTQMESMKKEIPTYFFQNSKNKLEFEIQTLQYFIQNTRQEQVGIFHRIDFYCILFITHGAGKHILNFEEFDYQPGTILFMAKNQVLKYKLNEKTKGYILFFKEEFLHQNKVQFNDLSYSFPFNFVLYSPVISTDPSDSSFPEFFDLIHKEFAAKSPSNNVEVVQCLLRSILLKVSSYATKSRVGNDYVSNSGMNLFIDFQRLIEQPNICGRNADDFCKVLRVSYKQLNRLSKTLTGKTVKVFIDDQFILKAKSMLIYSNSNVSEVAFSLGFEEVSNFTKYFKKHAKKTPTQFQQENYGKRSKMYL